MGFSLRHFMFAVVAGLMLMAAGFGLSGLSFAAEEAREPDIRGFYWGASMEEVEKAEKSKIIKKI